ncbi:MAG: glycosyltransferase [Dehalococcoidia bacterium]|jgi:glycosyltransferase involved in cell wall biosynthesis
MTAGDSLRLCVLGDLESIHTRRWLEPFVERGHEMHAVSYYPPARTIDGVRVHVLTERQREARKTGRDRGASPTLLPPTVLRLLNALRYRHRGLGRAVREIRPDVLHAHYVVEYGFFAAVSGFHPLIVTAWGSDILVAAQASPLARAIARYTLRHADLVTSNNDYMTRKICELGVPREKVATVVFGTDRYFLEQPEASVNRRDPAPEQPPVVISTRSLDSPLYNIDSVLRAMALLRRRLPQAQLRLAGVGRLQPALQRLVAELALGDGVQFFGFLDRPALRDALAAAHVYVSVPGSDATSVSNLSAMAAGCFPVVSDLASQEEWIQDGVNGYRVPLGDVAALAQRLGDALEDGERRREAASLNRKLVEERGLWEVNALEMERLYQRLARQNPSPGGR